MSKHLRFSFASMAILLVIALLPSMSVSAGSVRSPYASSLGNLAIGGVSSNARHLHKHGVSGHHYVRIRRAWLKLQPRSTREVLRDLLRITVGPVAPPAPITFPGAGAREAPESAGERWP